MSFFKVFVWTRRMHSWQGADNFLRRSQKMIAYCRILLKKSRKYRQEKSSNFCYGNLKCSFDIPAENFLTETKNFRSLANNDRNVSHPENGFTKVFLAHLDSNFDNSAETFFAMRPKKSCSLSKKNLNEDNFFS